MLSRRGFFARVAGIGAAISAGLAGRALARPYPRVLGAGQCGSSLITTGWASSPVPDMIVIAGLFMTNPRTWLPTEFARILVVTGVEQRADGSTLISIWPPIIARGNYQNCAREPANWARISEYRPKSGTEIQALHRRYRELEPCDHPPAFREPAPLNLFQQYYGAGWDALLKARKNPRPF